MKQYLDMGMVVVADGTSRRFGDSDKLTMLLNERPVFSHCLNTFSKFIPTENIILVVSATRENEFKALLTEQGLDDIQVVCGGAERKDSALYGLKAFPQDLTYAGVHDAARPFVTAEMLDKCHNSLSEHGSALLCRPVTDTIKIIDAVGKVKNTPARHLLAAAETPQIFRLELLLQAYEQAPAALNITDEAMAMEAAGHDVWLVSHEGDNRKITYSRDL